MLALLNERPVHPADVARITATVAPPTMIVCEPAETKKRPSTAIDAKFSIYFTLATALVKKQVVLASFPEAPRRDPAVLDCAAKVAYRVDAAVAKPLSAGGGTVLEVAL